MTDKPDGGGTMRVHVSSPLTSQWKLAPAFRVAITFSMFLCERIGRDKLKHCAALNYSRKRDGVSTSCATYDYCDPMDELAAALAFHGFDRRELVADIALAAWNLAREMGFWVFVSGSVDDE